ncbi:DUF397 domain-containing protein [Saccharothrix sp. NRRL B-16314]|uniref:DUF397 domain-containing protein n=1 Tax=Saccharothrix sp. NRRL B-16314 TaxID=1463825 RepID=UPI0009E0213A|nr:DUF397 domain-containing protein [Saccharothrix sp. NRRL B-16314]
MEEPRWRKSSRSGEESSCVELAHTLNMVRDSKNPTGPTLRFGPARLAVFLYDVSTGRLDG